MSVSIDKIHKLLCKAGHETTPPHEAHLCTVRAGQILNKGGMNFTDLGLGDAECKALRKISIDNKKKISQLEQDLSLAELETSRLREENIRLRQKEETLQNEGARLRIHVSELEGELIQVRRRQAKSAGFSSGPNRMNLSSKRHVHRSQDGAEYVDFDRLRAGALARLNRRSWKPAIACALRVTIKEVNAWEAVNLCPAYWLSVLDMTCDDDLAPASRKRWAADNEDLLKTALSENSDDLGAAVFLTKTLGLRIYETGVAYHRRRLYREQHWSPCASG